VYTYTHTNTICAHQENLHTPYLSL
jgi:hypothetical protein